MKQELIPTTEPDTSDRLFPHLTEMQERFLIAYVANGGKREAAALTAGYSKQGARQNAWRLLQRPEAIQALMQLSAAALGSHVPAAISQVAKLSLRAKSEYVKLEAAKDILDRVGLTAPKRIDLSGALHLAIDLD